jgi:hypothetical protein
VCVSVCVCVCVCGNPVNIGTQDARWCLSITGRVLATGTRVLGSGFHAVVCDAIWQPPGVKHATLVLVVTSLGFFEWDAGRHKVGILLF